MAKAVDKFGEYKDLTDLVKEMKLIAVSFDEKKALVEIWMKLEALKLKAKGRDFGQGFDKTGGEDEDF